MTGPRRPIIGERFERLVVVGLRYIRPSLWMLVCACDCGGEALATRSSLEAGKQKSCGCLRREVTSKRAFVHGHARPGRMTPEYRAWKEMIARCEIRSRINFPDYGGRGISVCERWRHGERGKAGFQCFLDDMGPQPFPGAELDRRRNEDDYEKNNCRWATRKQQSRNTRATRYVDFYGEPICLAEAVERYAVVAYDTACMRLHRGWSDNDALFVPRGGRPGDADREIPF